jgi:hypothetical protein
LAHAVAILGGGAGVTPGASGTAASSLRLPVLVSAWYAWIDQQANRSYPPLQI